MFCMLCDKSISDNDEQYSVEGGSVICEACFQSDGYTMCRHCSVAEPPGEIYEGYCESCYEYHSEPEWMDEYGGEDEYMDTYDPDRD